MSELFDLIRSRLDSDMLGAIAGRLGLGTEETNAVTATTLPALLGGMTQHAQTPVGARGLIDDIDASGAGGLDGLLDRFRGDGADSDAADEAKFGGMLGGGILDALIGRLGIGGPIVTKLVGMLGPLVIGALGKMAAGGKFSPARLTDVLGDATGAAADAAPGGRAGLASILGPIAGALGLGGAGVAAAQAQAPDSLGNVVDTVGERERTGAAAATGAGVLTGGSPQPRRRRGALGWIVGAVAVAALAAALLASRGCGDDDNAAPTSGTTVATTPATGDAASYSVVSDADGKVTLTGIVPSEDARTATVDAATATFGADNVTDRLTVDSAAAAGPAGDAVAATLAALKGAGSGWTAAFDAADSVTLTGEVASQAVKTALVAAATTAFAPGTVVDSLTVAAGGPSDEDTAAVDEINTQIQLTGVTFVTASADLTGPSRSTLDRVAGLLAQNESVTAEVQGHTDNQGNDSANLALSTARARAVVAYLAGKGIAASRLTAKGYGETRPVASNANDAGRSRNRRVVFVPAG